MHNTTQCKAIQCSAMQYNATQHSATLQCNAMLFHGMLQSMLCCNAMQCNAPHQIQFHPKQWKDAKVGWWWLVAPSCYATGFATLRFVRQRTNERTNDRSMMTQQSCLQAATNVCLFVCVSPTSVTVIRADDARTSSSPGQPSVCHQHR